MDSMSSHWVHVKEGVEDAVEKYEAGGATIEMSWLAPEQKDNAQQIQKIEAAIADGVDYIIIAVNDPTACNKALEEATDAGIKLIYVDSPADFDAEACFATNNYEGGVTAGEYLLKSLEEAGITEGEIGIVDAQAGVQSCQDRYDGMASVFEDTAYTLSERQYSDGDELKALELATTMLNNGVVALYGTNDAATTGAASAAAELIKSGENIPVVGWDNTDSNISHIENGELLAFMAQNPYDMGADAIDAVVSIERGEDLEGATVDTGVSTVDAENVADYK
jgi:ribose transport system substrate-binding protein